MSNCTKHQSSCTATQQLMLYWSCVELKKMQAKPFLQLLLHNLPLTICQGAFILNIILEMQCVCHQVSFAVLFLYTNRQSLPDMCIFCIIW